MGKGFAHKTSLPKEILFPGERENAQSVFSYTFMSTMHNSGAIKSKGSHTDEDCFSKFYILLDFPGFRQRLRCYDPTSKEKLGTHNSGSEVHKRPLSVSAKNKANSCSYLGALKLIREAELFYLQWAEFYFQ